MCPFSSSFLFPTHFGGEIGWHRGVGMGWAGYILYKLEGLTARNIWGMGWVGQVKGYAL